MKHLIKRDDITFYEQDHSKGDNAWAWGLILALALGVTVIIAMHFNLHLV